MCLHGQLVFHVLLVKIMRILVSRTYCALAPDDVSLLFSEEVLKSTPPRPTLGAGAADTAVEVANSEPNVNPPPPPPRVV